MEQEQSPSSSGRNLTISKAIPEVHKDLKYFERRRRNNLAAKKSRDARKLREDRVVTRVAILEQENAILRAQLAMLQDEAKILQVYLFHKFQGSNRFAFQTNFGGLSRLAETSGDPLYRRSFS